MAAGNNSKLSQYLQKQRDIRKLVETRDELGSPDTFDEAAKLKSDLESLMAEYRLTAEQMLESVSLLFAVRIPEVRLSDELPKPGQLGNQRDLTKPIREGTASREVLREATVMGRPKRVVLRPRRQASYDVEPGNREEGGLDVPASADEAGQFTGSGKDLKISAIIAPALQSWVNHKVIYVNPHTGEEIQVRGKNHRLLRSWYETYGEEVVEGWRKEG